MAPFSGKPRFAHGAPLLLDLVPGATVAFSSTHKLRRAYTGGVYQGWRATSGTTQDIPFAGDVPDLAALATFGAGNQVGCGAWRDQGLNGFDYSAPSQGQSPTVYTGAAVMTMANGKPALSWDGVDDLLRRTDTMGLLGSPALTVAWSMSFGAGTDNFTWSIGTIFGGVPSRSFLCNPYTLLRCGISGGGIDFVYPQPTSDPHSYIQTHPAGGVASTITATQDGVVLSGSGYGSPTQVLDIQNTEVGLGATFGAKTLQKMTFFAVWPRLLTAGETAAVRAEQVAWGAGT